MKIALYTQEFPYNFFSESSFVCPELKDLGNCEIDIFPLSNNGEGWIYNNDGRNIDNIFLHSKKFTFRAILRTLYLFFIFLLSEIKTKNFSFQIVLALSRQAAGVMKCITVFDQNIEKFDKYDLHYFFWKNEAAVAFSLIKKNYPEFLAICRCHNIDLYSERVGLSKLFGERHVLSSFNLIAPISDHGAKYLSDKYPEYKKKISSLPIGIKADGAPAERPFNLSQPIKILSVSSASPVKRLPLIYQALEQFSSNNVDLDFEWIHVGKWDEGININQNSRLRINYMGSLNQDELYEQLMGQNILCLINLSKFEGRPFSIMEAKAHNLPVVATDVGGSAELLSKVTCDFVIPDNHDVIKLTARALQELLEMVKTKGSLPEGSAYKNFSSAQYTLRLLQQLDRIVLENIGEC